MERDRRQFKRIIYPEDRTPKLSIRQKEGETKRYEVLDISEKGIRLTGEELGELQPKSRIEAQITFSDGESIDVEGEMLRVSDDQAVVYLYTEIPPSRITKENELLRD